MFKPTLILLIMIQEIGKAIFKNAKDRSPGNNNIFIQACRTCIAISHFVLFNIFYVFIGIDYGFEHFRNSITITIQKLRKKMTVCKVILPDRAFKHH